MFLIVRRKQRPVHALSRLSRDATFCHEHLPTSGELVLSQLARKYLGVIVYTVSETTFPLVSFSLFLSFFSFFISLSFFPSLFPCFSLPFCFQSARRWASDSAPRTMSDLRQTPWQRVCTLCKGGYDRHMRTVTRTLDPGV